MTTPSFGNWRANSSANNGLVAQTIRERIVAALATFASNMNPDGTTKGS